MNPKIQTQMCLDNIKQHEENLELLHELVAEKKVHLHEVVLDIEQGLRLPDAQMTEKRERAEYIDKQMRGLEKLFNREKGILRATQDKLEQLINESGDAHGN